MALLTDPIDLVQDPLTGDLIVDASGPRFTSGLEGVAQGIRRRISTFKGEWFLDRERGIPYLENDLVSDEEAFIGGKFDEIRTLNAYRTLIREAPGVRAVEALTLDLVGTTRQLRVNWRVSTIFDDTIEESTPVGV